MNEKEINYSLKKYMEEIVQNDLDKFDTFIRWGDSEKEEFKVLLHQFTTFINEILVAQSVVLKHS